MIKLENVEVMGWEHAIRGMRNPKNSWEKIDSAWDGSFNYWTGNPGVTIGPNDHTLMMNLAHGGPVHAKYRRMITVYLDITAPLYWWKEFDTYRVGVEKNSCSTMHKIHAKEFELSDFSTEHLLHFQSPGDERDIPRIDVSPLKDDMFTYSPYGVLELITIPMLNKCRDMYLETMSKPMKDNTKRSEVAKKYWWQMIQLLPTSYNQKRTVMLNYEVLAGMYESRKNHKLDEWREFCKWIESLPYSELITGEREDQE
jgi:hypothetical protein